MVHAQLTVGWDDVRDYTIFVHDRRWREPLTLAAQLAHDARAREFARERLASSIDYEAVEVWREGLKLYHAEAAASIDWATAAEPLLNQVRPSSL